MKPFRAPRSYGMAAEFATPEDLLGAVRAVVDKGYTHAEAYSPFVVEGVSEKLGFRRSWVAFITLMA